MSLKPVAKCLVIVGFVSVKLMLIIGDPHHNDWSQKGGGMDFKKFGLSHSCIATKIRERMTNSDFR